MQYTVADLEAMAKALKEKREEVAAKKAVYSEANTALEGMELNLLNVLKSIGKSSYKSEHGTIIRTEQMRVNLPKTREDWQKLFEYLKERGQYDEYVTVNSQRLNSFYSEEYELIKKSDPIAALNFGIPGVEEPKIREILSFRK